MFHYYKNYHLFFIVIYLDTSLKESENINQAIDTYKEIRKYLEIQNFWHSFLSRKDSFGETKYTFRKINTNLYAYRLYIYSYYIFIRACNIMRMSETYSFNLHLYLRIPRAADCEWMRLWIRRSHGVDVVTHIHIYDFKRFMGRNCADNDARVLTFPNNTRPISLKQKPINSRRPI